MLKNNKIRKELIRKVGTEGAMVLITIASNGGAMKEQDLLKSSSDGIEEMRSYEWIVLYGFRLSYNRF